MSSNPRAAARRLVNAIIAKNGGPTAAPKTKRSRAPKPLPAAELSASLRKLAANVVGARTPEVAAALPVTTAIVAKVVAKRTGRMKLNGVVVQPDPTPVVVTAVAAPVVDRSAIARAAANKYWARVNASPERQAILAERSRVEAERATQTPSDIARKAANKYWARKRAEQAAAQATEPTGAALVASAVAAGATVEPVAPVLSKTQAKKLAKQARAAALVAAKVAADAAAAKAAKLARRKSA